MPTRLNEFPIAHRQSRYDWNQLLDGAPWELVSGIDFSGKAKTFAVNARYQASKRGGRVRVRHFTHESPERLVIQFISD